MAKFHVALRDERFYSMEIEAETAEQAKERAVTKLASLEWEALEPYYECGGDLEAVSVTDEHFNEVEDRP